MIHAQRASGFILLLVIFTCANAAAQDYYKSKFIRFIVGQAAGGGYDTYTRTIARHIVNHIPGNPGVTVE